MEKLKKLLGLKAKSIRPEDFLGIAEELGLDLRQDLLPEAPALVSGGRMAREGDFDMLPRAQLKSSSHATPGDFLGVDEPFGLDLRGETSRDMPGLDITDETRVRDMPGLDLRQDMLPKATLSSTSPVAKKGDFLGVEEPFGLDLKSDLTRDMPGLDLRGELKELAKAQVLARYKGAKRSDFLGIDEPFGLDMREPRAQVSSEEPRVNRFYENDDGDKRVTRARDRQTRELLAVPPEKWTKEERSLMRASGHGDGLGMDLREETAPRHVEEVLRDYNSGKDVSPAEQKLLESYRTFDKKGPSRPKGNSDEAVEDMLSEGIPGAGRRHGPQDLLEPGQRPSGGPRLANGTGATQPPRLSSKSPGRARPRADVQPLDSSEAVKAGQALLSRLKSPGNGSALPDSVRQWARRGQPAQSEDASGSGGGEGSNGTSRMDWARMIDSGAATVAGVKPNSEFYDAVERRGERKDKLKAEKEQSAQAESLRREQMAQSDRQHQDRMEERGREHQDRMEQRARELEQKERMGQATLEERRERGAIMRMLAERRLDNQETRGSSKDDVLTFTRWKLRDGRSIRPGEAEKFRKEDGASEQIDGTAGEMAGILKRAGGYKFVPGNVRADLGVLRQGLQYALKDTEGMGALQKAEIDRLNQMIEDPSTLENMLKSEAGYGEAVRRLEAVQRLYKARSATRADALGLDWTGDGEAPQAFGRPRGGGQRQAPRPQQPQPGQKVHMRNDETGEELNVDPSDVSAAEKDNFRRVQ